MSEALLFEVAKVTKTLDACVASAVDDPAVRRLAARFGCLGLQRVSGAAVPHGASHGVVGVIAPVGPRSNAH